MSKQNRIWVNAEQLNNDPEFLQAAAQEINPLSAEHLADEKSTGGLKSNRRDFLKMLGFSLGAATIASCDIPVRKAIPYTQRPEEIVPGVANYYASSYINGGEYCSVLVKTREGRPIKIEGNSLSSISRGGTSARAQASVLSLYDTARIQNAGRINNGALEEMSWADLDNAIKSGLASSANIRIMTQTQLSPTLGLAMGEFVAKYPNAKIVTYDPISCSGLLDAVDEAMGMRVIPDYKIANAKVLVGIDCDFLGTWVSPVEYAAQYAERRRVHKMGIENAKNEMSKHIQFESRMSLTGSNADQRVLIKPSEMGLAVATLHNAVASELGEATVSVSGSFAWPKAAAGIKNTAKALLAAKGNALVMCGVNDKSVQALVLNLNRMLLGMESTFHFVRASNQLQGSDKAVNDLLSEMGSVDAIIFYNCNPAYDLPGRAAEFADKLKNVKLSVSLNGTLNETALLCKYAAPDHHVLESWGDAEPKSGCFSLIQPTIRPIFNTRQAGQSFLVWAESANLNASAEQPYYEYLKKTWTETVFTMQSQFATPQAFWDNSLHSGIFEVAEVEASGVMVAPDMNAIAAALPKPSGEGLEVSFYEPVGVGNGSHANNPWLQEMPDPVMRTVWDNFVSIPIKYDAGSNNFVAELNHLNDGDLVKVSVNGVDLVLPVVRQFGQAPGTVAIALGYGRTAAGKAGNGVGQNFYPAVKTNANGYAQYSASGVTVSESEGSDTWFASVQMHHTYGITTEATGDNFNVDELVLGYRGFQGSLTGRSVLFNSSAAELAEKAEELKEKRAEWKHLNEQSLYPDYSADYGRSQFWGMSIDLTACIGCGACQVACVAENNVPVVGKREVARKHEMTWLRIDRYYYGDEETPHTAYMPLMCQHCQNAPCENVCPVNATNHSFEGLNQMAYNRCIGTRYCANNCPFKVRRFNWLDYTAADMFPWNEHNLHSADSDKEAYNFYADDLVRMVLNPDVTVRSRGVIEKCSLCVQRIQQGKLVAKVEGRGIADGDIKSACQTACPTGAIVFGDRNDKDSKVMSLWNTPLNYHALEEINVRPSMSYLMKVNNSSEEFFS